jgi:hypothetical protein
MKVEFDRIRNIDRNELQFIQKLKPLRKYSSKANNDEFVENQLFKFALMDYKIIKPPK